MTRPAIRTAGIARRSENLMNALTFADVLSALQAANRADQDTFAAAIYSGQPGDARHQATWEALDDILRPFLESQATSEVDAAIGRGSFTLDEIESILL